MSGYSQLTSAVQAIAGDLDEAKRTQEQFLSKKFTYIQKSIDDNTVNKIIWNFSTGETIDSPIDSLPIIGHIKGAFHSAVGDEKRGMEIIKGATSNTIVTVGGLLGGPAGAVASKIVSDGILTAIDSAKSGKFTPHGVMNINATVVDKFDILAEMAFSLRKAMVIVNNHVSFKFMFD